MLSPGQGMVLNMEHLVPPTPVSPSSLSTLSGIVDYTAIIASKEVAGKSVLTYLNRQGHYFLQLVFRDHWHFITSGHICHLASLL